ncbi:MAG: FliA/WhiG family RNA polymerase sigma factor [Acidobacteriota bacterium]
MSIAYFPHAALKADAFHHFNPNESLSHTRRHTLRDARIIENLQVVGIVLQRLLPRLPSSVEADDLHSAGVMGLIDAAHKFDESRAVRFRTYAELRVRGAMLDYLRSLSWAPRGLHRREREMEGARAAIEQKTHRSATVSEIARELGIKDEECHRLMAQISRLRLSDDDDLGDERVHASRLSASDDPHFHIERKELIRLIWQAARSLPERLQFALRLYYIEEMTMKDVGAALDVNEARASQLLSKAVALLREEMIRLLNPRREMRATGV